MAGLYIQTSTHILTPTDDIPVRIDISTIDNGEIGEVLGDLSQGFQRAGTEEHNRFFNSAFDVAGQTINGVSQSIECSINNEVETLAYGTLTLESWDPVTKIYSCSFSSGVVSLADSLEGLLVRDASWSDLDHTYTMDHAISQNTMQSLPTYFYPMVDFGFDEATQPRVPNDVTLASVNISGANQQTSYYNTNYFQQQYNSLHVGQQTPATTSRLYTPSIYFGEVAQGGEIQGYITHPMTPLRIHQLLPAVQVTEVIDRIFRQAGKTYTADFFPMIADQYILAKANEGLGFEGNFTDDIGFISTQTNYNVPELNIYQTARKRGRYRRIWAYGSTAGTTSQFNPGSNFNANNGVYTAPRTGSYEFEFTGTLDNVSGRLDNVFNNAFLEMAVSILVNGNRVESIDLPRIGNRDDFNNGEPFSWELKWTGALYEGQRVTAELGVTGSRSADDLTGTLSNLSFRTRQVPIDYNGETINIGTQFGDTESLELLNALVSKYNLVIEQSRDRADHYNIYQYYDWVLSGPRVDWTDKVDEDTISFSSLLSEQERVVEFTDAEDDDRLNQETIELFVDETYGKHTYTSTSDVPSGDSTVGDFFGPLVVASPGEAGNITKPITTSVANGIPHLYDWDGTEAKSFQPAMRIGYRKMISWPSEIFYANANNNIVRYPGGSFVTLSNTNDAGNQDINYSSNGAYSDSTIADAYGMYWEDYINHIYNPANRKMTCRVFFTPSEYATLRMNSIVSIKGNDYLIKNISGFNLSNPDSVEVELITYQNNFQTVFTEPTNQFYELDEDERTHLVGLTVVGVDDDMVTVIPNSVEGNNHYFRSSGDVGESETFTYTIAAQPGFEVNVSNFTNNSASLPGVSVSNVVENANGTISVDVAIEIQSEHTFSTLIFTGEVDRQISGNTDFSINWLLDSSVTGATIQGLGDTRGPIGARSTLLATIAPPDGQRLNASSFTHGTLPTGIISLTFTQFGFNVIATAVVEYQPTNVNPTVNIDGDNPTSLPSGTQTSEITLDFTEMITNVSTIADLTFRGVVGTRSDLQIPLYAADGYTLDSGNFSATVGSGHGYVTMFDATGGGDTVTLPIAVVFPSSDATVPITLNGAAQLIGAEVFSITVNWDVSGLTNGTLTENTETFRLNAGQSIKYTNDVLATPGYNVNTVTVTETSDLMNVVSDIRTNARGDGSQIHLQVTAGTSDATATLAVNGAGSAEDHFVRFDINSQELSFAGANMISHIEGFDTDETGDAYNFSFTVNSTGNMMYDSSNLPSVSIGSAVLANGGGAASITTPTATVGTPDANGNVSISIGGTFPMVPQDVVIPISITDEPVFGNAMVGSSFTMNRFEVQTGVARTFDAVVVANGAWRVVSTGLAPSLGADGTVLSSSSTQMTGQVSITLPSQTSTGAITVARLESLNTPRSTLDTLTIDVVEPPLSGDDINVGRTYRLTATSSTARFVYSPVSSSTTTSVQVNQGSPIMVESRTLPFTVQGSGNVEDLGVTAQSSNNSTQWNGFNQVVNVGGTAGTQTNTIYFN